VTMIAGFGPRDELPLLLPLSLSSSPSPSTSPPVAPARVPRGPPAALHPRPPGGAPRAPSALPRGPLWRSPRGQGALPAAPARLCVALRRRSARGPDGAPRGPLPRPPCARPSRPLLGPSPAAPALSLARLRAPGVTRVVSCVPSAASRDLARATRSRARSPSARGGRFSV
jgi:hypothetical protein